MDDELFQKTVAWMKRSARPLEDARWAYLFEDGAKENVIKYLSAFQNGDGGFGHGLEPDSMLPDSNAIDTWAACQILMEVEAGAEEDIVQSTLKYLMASYDEQTGLWRTVISEHNDHPHAPWWHYDENAQDSWMYNPSVELATYLIHWGDDEMQALGMKVMDNANIRLLNCTEMDFHEVNNYQNAYEIIGGPSKEVRTKLNELIEASMDTDADGV